MDKIKIQIIQQIKDFISLKNTENISSSFIAKGKTIVSKIIYDIWIAIGF